MSQRQIVIGVVVVALAIAALPLLVLNLANVCLLHGRADASLDHAYASLKAPYVSAGAHMARARLAARRHDDRAEIEQLKLAARTRPVAAFLLGNALERNGNHDEAIRAYAQAPRSERYFLERGRTAAAKNGWSAAVTPVRTAVEIRPSSADAQRAWAAVQINALSDLDGAIASLEKARTIGVADGFLQIEIAHAQQMARHDDDALRSLDEFHGEHPLAHAIRGAIYLKRNRTADALHEMQRAVDLDPNNVWYLFDYGNALCASGRGAEARAAWQRALQHDPHFTPALAARCAA